MNLAQKPERHGRVELIRRHSIVTRLTHWLNVFCLSFLLLSGLQIFNAHPELYWGHYGNDGDPAVLTIGSEKREDGLRGFVRVVDAELTTTGLLGVSSIDGRQSSQAFPAWATIPSYKDLAAGRRWHFFFAWLFVTNGIVYVGYSLVTGHLRRDLVPAPRQVSPAHLWREILDHARLRFPEGEEARRYNALQKLTYLLVVVILLPTIVLTGLTMSPGMDAAFPVLVDLFGGRQSARTIHFIVATSLVLFIMVHVAMVMLSGPWNNMRSMISGRYAIRYKDQDHE